MPEARDHYKRLGIKNTLADMGKVRFHMHSQWPTSEQVERGPDHGDFVVRTEAGTMLVGYYWREGDQFMVRRASTMNTIKWLD